MSEPNRPDRQPRKNGGAGGNGGGTGGGRNNPSGMRFGRGIFGWVLFILLAVMLFVLVQGKNRQAQHVDLGDFDTMLQQGYVKELTIQGDEITGEFTKPFSAPPDGHSITSFRTELPTGNGNEWAFTRDMLAKRGNAKVKVENSQNLLIQVLVPLIPWLLIFAFIWF